MGDEHDLEGLPGADGDPDGEPGGDPAGEPDAFAAALALTPEALRNTPEFRALEKAHRKTARQLGTANRQLSAVRTQAEADRQAAEAERQAALEAHIEATLGEDGVAAFQELAELSQTDPVAAATRFAELMANAQSAPPAANGGEPTDTDPSQEALVNASVPPPPGGGVDGSAPLQPAPRQDEIEALTRPLDERYAQTVERNLSPLTRNRVTMRERAAALIGYVESAYIKAIGAERNVR